MSLYIRSFIMISLCCTLLACGFQLRGDNAFDYQTLYISGQTQINKMLKKRLISNNVSIVDSAEQAEMQLELINENYEKRILSLSGTGRVNEYELYYRLRYRTKSSQQALWQQPLIMEVRRDFSYSDVNALSKESEEKALIEDMHKQVVNNLTRRLSVLKK
jgi:LPS-assembly lipoprotein